MKHSVNIGNNNRLHNVSRNMYEPGEKVYFHVMQPCDADLRITSEQVDITPEGGVPTGALVYSFVMPDCDVEVKISITNSMERLGFDMRQKPCDLGPPFGGFADMRPEHPPFKDMIFCPECGVQVEDGQKYCHECGYRLIDPDGEDSQ